MSRVLEHRALLALDAFRTGSVPLAHTLLLPKLPPVAAGARMLAGHANAARGRDLLWIVGAGAGAARTGVEVAAVRHWLGEVEPAFDAPAPEIEVVPMAVEGLSLTLLAVRTTRAPFVLRPRGARPGEVPWFDARSGKVRSAQRLDLVRLVTPLGELPQLEVLEAELTFFKNALPRSRTTFRWTLDASVYLLPRGGERLIIPLHKVRADLIIDDWRNRAAEVHVTGDRQSPALRVTESALLADGLGRFFLYCAGSTEAESVAWDSLARFTAEFMPAGAELSALAVGEMRRQSVLEPNQMARWKSA